MKEQVEEKSVITSEFIGLKVAPDLSVKNMDFEGKSDTHDVYDDLLEGGFIKGVTQREDVTADYRPKSGSEIDEESMAEWYKNQDFTAIKKLCDEKYPKLAKPRDLGTFIMKDMQKVMKDIQKIVPMPKNDLEFKNRLGWWLCIFNGLVWGVLLLFIWGSKQ